MPAFIGVVVMSEELKAVIASNVNEEAVVFLGATAGELMTIASAVSLTTVPVFVIIGLLLEKATIFLTLSMVAIFLQIFVIASILQKVKRGRPDGYYQQIFMMFKGRFKIGKSSFVDANGFLSTARTQQCVLIKKHLKQGDARG